jgi:murein DD-endopeptidase MepM/ murein hydrolase activator NlpD
LKRQHDGARVGILIAAALTAGCSMILPDPDPPPLPVPLEDLLIDQDVTELYAMMRHDWAILNERLSEIPPPSIAAPAPATGPRTSEPTRITLPFTADAVLASMYIPVVGVSPTELRNSFGAPRDGGTRRHRGIDIPAPRGSKVVAVADGEISYVGTQSKAGRSVWLVTDAGVSFFYAHLDRWANGLREGLRVRKGQTIGYVGNSGNARRSSPHLHFAIHRHSEAINPYPHLVAATMPEKPRPVLSGGMTAGSQ